MRSVKYFISVRNRGNIILHEVELKALHGKENL